MLCWFALQKSEDGLPKLWAQLQIAGLFLHYQSPSAGTIFVAFCPGADIFLHPGWYPVKVHSKCLFSGCSVSCINMCVVMTFHSLGYPASEYNLCGWVYHRTPNCRPSHVMGHPNTHTLCPQTPFGLRYPMPHPAEQKSRYSMRSLIIRNRFQSVK